MMPSATVIHAYGIRPSGRLRVRWPIRMRPIEQWNTLQVRSAMTALCIVSFVCTLHGLYVARDESLRAHRLAVAALQEKVAHAHRQARALPALRQQADALHSALVESDIVQEMQRIGATATRAGLLIDSVEPAAEAGLAGPRGDDRTQPVGQHAVRLAASGDFVSAWSFLGALSTLPVIAMPDEVQLKLEGGQLSLRAVLMMFGINAGSGPAELECSAVAGAPYVPLPQRAAAHPDTACSAGVGMGLTAFSCDDARRRMRSEASPLPPDPFAFASGPRSDGRSATRGAWIGIIWSRSRRAAVVESTAPHVLVPKRAHANPVRAATASGRPRRPACGADGARIAPCTGTGPME